MRQLKNWLSGFMTYADNSEPPVIFKKWTGLMCIASALQRRCYVEWDGIIYPNMYVILVGASGGVRKGTAMNHGLDIITQESTIQVCADAITREALVSRMNASNVMITDPITNEVKPHSSITIWSQELTVFIGYNNLQLIVALTDWYDCKDYWKYECVGRGKEEIHGVWVNMFGATTPDMLKSALPQDAIGGGFTSRIIFVYGDKKSKIVKRPQKTPAEKELREKLIYDLNVICQMNGQFQMTDGYLDLKDDWYEKHSISPPFSDYRLRGYNERRATHLLKLSMVLSAARSNNLLIDEEIFFQAEAILNETEEKMPKVFGSYGRREKSDLLPEVYKTIAVLDGGIKFSDLVRRYIQDFDKDEMIKIIETFCAGGYCATQRIEGTTDFMVYVKDITQLEKKE